jgi:hypothetical protein
MLCGRTQRASVVRRMWIATEVMFLKHRFGFLRSNGLIVHL